MKNLPRRSRVVYALCILLVIFFGLLSRSKQIPWPGFVVAYAGDTLWALTAFLGFGWLLPKLSTWRVAALAAAFSLLIELSQLYHALWLDALRDNRFGALVLGQGFLWSDLVCYAAGIACGVAAEWLVATRRK